MSLKNRKILIGVTGSIAAYKTCELVRLLTQGGAHVRVVMTKGGAEFIKPMTFQALSGERVRTDLLDEASEAAMGHIELARWADLILIAPASANFIARFVQGMADDLLTTLCLATNKPVYLAPAMNQQMWANEFVQQNITSLKQANIEVWGPAAGDQACGDEGLGRLLEASELFEKIQACFSEQSLAGKQVVITAGATQEAIDPVRYLSNRSSGKMGYALAQAAQQAGAAVTLVSGPTHLNLPPGVDAISVKTAEQMREAVMNLVKHADIFISAAAVSDYRVAQSAEKKIKKDQEELSLQLIRNPDILAEVAGLKEKPFVVGFAAETHNVIQYAQQKLTKKNLDMIIANQVGENHGFDSDENEVTVLFKNGDQKKFPRQSKQQLARQIVELLV